MPGIARKPDACDGACGHPPSPPAQWSSNVFANNQNVVRQSDQYQVHPDGFHPGRVVSAGSSTVFVNNKQTARQGDPISCGAAIATGSGDVIVGG